MGRKIALKEIFFYQLERTLRILIWMNFVLCGATRTWNTSNSSLNQYWGYDMSMKLWAAIAWGREWVEVRVRSNIFRIPFTLLYSSLYWQQGQLMRLSWVNDHFSLKYPMDGPSAEPTDQPCTRLKTGTEKNTHRHTRGYKIYNEYKNYNLRRSFLCLLFWT